MEPSDEELIQAFKGGDVSAFEKLYGRYERPIFTFVIRLMGRSDQAMDVAQEVFYAMWRKLPAWRPGASFKAWLYRVAFNRAVKEREGGRARTRREQAVSPAGPGPTDPGKLAVRTEEDERVRAALTSLPRGQQACVVLRYDHSLSYAEIAEVLGITEGGARANVFGALAALRRKLNLD